MDVYYINLKVTVTKLSSTLEKRRSFIINFVYYMILVILFCLALAYAFRPMLPIIIAIFVAILLQKPVNKIVAKTKIPKGLVSAIAVLLVMVSLVAIIFFIGSRLFKELKDFIDFIRLKIEDYAWIESQIYYIVNKLPSYMKDAITPTVNDFLDKLKPAMESDAASGVYKIGFSAIKFPSVKSIFPGVLNTAMQIPSIFIAVLICVILSCFMTAEYDVFSKAIKKYVPGGENNIFSATKRVLLTSVFKLLKAYFFIMCITFSEMLVGLSLFKLIGIFDSKYIFAISLFAAVFDIMPILGIGGILWTWSIFEFVTGNVAMGVALILLYIFITIVRQIIEPKLVAGQMSLPSSLTLAVMYIGLKMFGVIGMFAFTISLYCLKVLDSEGVIHLFGGLNRAEHETGEEHSDKSSEEMKPVSV